MHAFNPFDPVLSIHVWQRLLSLLFVTVQLPWHHLLKRLFFLQCMVWVITFVNSVQLSSVTQSCPTRCNPMNHSTPGLPVHHQLRVHPNACPLSRWCHQAISSSVIPFSSCPQSFPAWGSFQMSQLFPSDGQSIGVSALASVLPMNTQDWSPLGWTGWISLQCKGLSRVFSNTTVQKHQLFGVQPSLWSNSHIHTDHWENHSVDCTDLCWQNDVSAF